MNNNASLAAALSGGAARLYTNKRSYKMVLLFVLVGGLFTATGAISFEDSLKYTANDYYGALELNPDDKKNIETREIKKAFRKLSLLYHPDKTKLPQEEAKQKFEDISNAYEILKDDTKRAEYDKFINSLPFRIRPAYGKTLFKPSVVMVITVFFIAMFIGISILQYNSFQIQKKRVMQTPQYKNDLQKIRSSSDITIDAFHKQIFYGKDGWKDTIMLSIPISIYHFIICKPCREHAKVRKVEEKLREIDMQEQKKQEQEEAMRKKIRSERRKERNQQETEREEREQEQRQKEKRIGFLKVYYDELKEDNVFEEIENALEEPGIYTGRTLKELVKKIEDDNDVDDFNLMLDVYIETYEQDAEDARLAEEERQILLQEEEDRKQREMLLNNNSVKNDDVDGDVNNTDEDSAADAEAEAKRNEEWLKEMEEEKQLKLKLKTSKKSKKRTKKVVGKEKKGRIK